MNLPRAVVRHSLPARTRIGIAERRGETAYFEQVGAELDRHEQVFRVRVNATAGSVLILHQEDALAAIAEHARRQELFELTQLELTRESGLAQSAAGLERLDTGLRRMTAGELSANTLVFAALVGLALVQAVRGQFAAPAVTLLWYALELLNRNRPKRQ